jgi:hypothetical protein
LCKNGSKSHNKLKKKKVSLAQQENKKNAELREEEVPAGPAERNERSRLLRQVKKKNAQVSPLHRENQAVSEEMSDNV